MIAGIFSLFFGGYCDGVWLLSVVCVLEVADVSVNIVAKLSSGFKFPVRFVTTSGFLIRSLSAYQDEIYLITSYLELV